MYLTKNVYVEDIKNLNLSLTRRQKNKTKKKIAKKLEQALHKRKPMNDYG